MIDKKKTPDQITAHGISVDNEGRISQYPKVRYQWGQTNSGPPTTIPAGSVAPNGNYVHAANVQWNRLGELHLEFVLTGWVNVANSSGVFGITLVPNGDPAPVAGSTPHVYTYAFRNAANQHAVFPPAFLRLSPNAGTSPGPALAASGEDLFAVYVCAWQGAGQFDNNDVLSIRTILIPPDDGS